MAVEAEILHGVTPLVTAGPTLSKGGFGELDSLSVEMLCGPNWETEVDAAGYEHLKKIAGYHSMWVQSHQAVPDGSLHTVSIGCVGLWKSGERRKRTLSCVGQQVSVGPVEKVILVWDKNEVAEDPEGEEANPKGKRRIPKVDEEGEPVYKTITTPSGVNDRWTVRDAALSVSDHYYATVKPPTNVINTVQVPPTPPTPPPDVWAGYTEPMRYRHPNGWILVDRRVTVLFEDGLGGGLYEVEDVYEFYYGAVPD